MKGLRLAGTLVIGAIALVGCLRFGATAIGGDHRVAGRNLGHPGVFELADPTGFTQVIAVSDVHGMDPALVQLLTAAKVIDAQQKWAAGRTLLIVVGDSIDKGPQSIEVIDRWMSLSDQAQAAGGLVVHTLGNHEAEFLAAPNNGKAKELLAELQQRQIPLTDLTDPSRPRGAFLHQEPVAARVGQWLFAHAGLYPNLSWSDFKTQAQSVLSQGAYGDPFLADGNSILEAKDWWKDAAARQQLEARLTSNGMFGLVQGHQPKAYNMPNTIGAIDSGRLIKIDNGMAPEAGSNPGHLLRFSQPAELTKAAFPHADVIGPDGTVTPLVPAKDLPPAPAGGNQADAEP